MQNDILASVSRLSDGALVAEVKSLMGRERHVTAEIVAHLAELDTRDVHLREGYSSLFVYCRDALGLSDWEAYNRIEVARTVRRFPVILGLLADGAVNVTTIRLLGPHLTPTNHGDVLESARGKGKELVKEIVARLAPRPDAPTVIRRLRARQPEALTAMGSQPMGPEGGSVAGDAAAGRSEAPTVAAGRSEAPTAAASPSAGGVSEPPTSSAGASRSKAAVNVAPVTPLSPDRYKLQLTISGDTLEKLRLAKDMLGHALPAGDESAVVDRALTLLLVDLARRKFADTPRPRAITDNGTRAPAPTAPRPPRSRYIAASVKRAVWVRDLGRCAFVGQSGHRCNERRFMEFHHVDPHALGGEATVDGIQLRCRRHNDYEGRLYFGKRRRGRELVPEQVPLSTCAQGASDGGGAATASASQRA